MVHAILLLSLAHAEDAKPAAPPAPSVKVGGIIFAHWGYDLASTSDDDKENDNYNEFAVDRVYFRAESTINDHLGTKVTLDADRMKAVETDTGSFTYDTKYRVFVKHAYLEWRDPAPGVKARFGMVDTPYAPFSDNFWGHRYVMESFGKQNKVLETADLGVSVQGTHSGGLIDWNAALLNGEGYSKVEVDRGKALQGRFTLDPLAPKKKMGLPITAFVSYNGGLDVGADDDYPVITYIGSVGYKMPFLLGWAEYLGVKKGEAGQSMGYSATLMPRSPKVGSLIVRYDHFDVDTKTEKDATSTIVIGASHDFAEKVSAALTYERTTPEATPDEVAHGVFVRMQAGF